MARGSIAKEKVIEKIKEAFGEEFVGEFDKKLYVWANDGGERVQISIALTCPKNFVAVDEPSGFPEASTEAPVSAQTAEITDEERKNIADLMARLGL